MFSTQNRTKAGDELWSSLCWIYGLELNWRQIEEARIRGLRDGEEDYAEQVREKTRFEELIARVVSTVMEKENVDEEARGELVFADTGRRRMRSKDLGTLCKCYRYPHNARIRVDEFVSRLAQAESKVLAHVLPTGKMLGKEQELHIEPAEPRLLFCLDLPEHISSWTTIETMLKDLANLLNEFKTPPRLETLLILLYPTS